MPGLYASPMAAPHPNTSMMMLIVSAGPRTGKTTARLAFARGMGLPGTSTSELIAGVLEDERGWPTGTVAKARETDRDAYREDLREVGDRIGKGRRPAIVRAIDAGYRVVDGCRRASELDAGIRRARKFGLEVWVVWIGGRPARGSDNTEAERLHKRVTMEIPNTTTVAELDHAIESFLRDMDLLVPGVGARPESGAGPEGD